MTCNKFHLLGSEFLRFPVLDLTARVLVIKPFFIYFNVFRDFEINRNVGKKRVKASKILFVNKVKCFENLMRRVPQQRTFATQFPSFIAISLIHCTGQDERDFQSDPVIKLPHIN